KAHLTPTLFAIGCYHVLKTEPPKKFQLIDFTWKNHPYDVWHRSSRRFIFDYQQIQALAWLGEDLSSFRNSLTKLKEPRDYSKRYETGGNPHFEAEVKHFKSRQLCGLPAPAPVFEDFINIRQRPNGSFNTIPTKDGGDGNVLNTWFALEALDTVGKAGMQKDSLIRWLQACQLPNGGFTHQPNAEMGGVDDAAYTWAAIRSLSMLGAEPANKEACVDYLRSLANHDGGFADRPGWQSNPMACYYALDSLAHLGELNFNSIKRPSKPPRKRLPGNLKVFSIQVESHGTGSPQETVALAKALKIHLWGSKNAKPGWREKVAELAKQGNVPVKFFLADEEYGSLIKIPGMGTYSHIADIMSPADADIGPSLAQAGPVSWPEFKERRLKPLRAAKGRLNWQFGVHEDVIRVFLDDSLDQPGYSTISTFHFGNIDFATSEPFLHRWRGQIPYIALQDAHGIEPWWFSDQTEGMRTLFLGTEPTWDAWLKALENNWVASVRHDYRNDYQTWMHSGSDEISDYMRKHELDWRWWDNPAIGRPMVSMVAVRPIDEFEAGRPEEGLNLRIRIAHRNSNHGHLQEPLAEFISLTVNGKTVEPELVSTPDPRDAKLLVDQCRLFPLADGAGTLTAEVKVKQLLTGRVISQAVAIKT
ncbi:MAG: prenyltransferase, partial [Verrucomicrobiae bacterium]|nr:prenyltransferase [Verrucomicrobiae bacterium]